ncbi:MAG: methyltransferase [Burkholderiaceae bacterium]|nr:methyltransferase [Burkholderiaceae bacterium]
MTSLPQSKYQIIYADPPWSYNDKSKHRGGAERHYRTLKIDDLCKMDVQSIAADDCALFLWATFPQMAEALKLIEAWGFTYKTAAFTWVKTNKVAPSLFWGMGSWTRANAEICLLAIKGKPKRVSAAVHQVIQHPVMAHSQKPDEARQRIVALLGDVPRIELFARQRSPGWDSWGNDPALEAA